MPTILDTLIKNHDDAGRDPNCKIRIWAANQKAILDALPTQALRDLREDVLRAALVRHEDWRWEWSVQAILATKDYAEPRKTRVQLVYMIDIAKSADDQARAIVNSLLLLENKTPGTLSPTVAKAAQKRLEGSRFRGLSPALRAVYDAFPNEENFK